MAKNKDVLLPDFSKAYVCDHGVEFERKMLLIDITWEKNSKDSSSLKHKKRN